MYAKLLSVIDQGDFSDYLAPTPQHNTLAALGLIEPEPITFCLLGPQHLERVGTACKIRAVPVTWAVRQELPKIPRDLYAALIQRALDTVRKHCGLRHEQVPPSVTANISAHCRAIDGQGRVLGETELPCGMQLVRMWLDIGEAWNTELAIRDGIIAYLVILHELLHALGLPHAPATGNIMFPYYNPDQWTLGPWDVQQLQVRYGPPEPVSTPPPLPPPIPSPVQPTGGKPVNTRVYDTILGILHIAQVAAKLTPTTADDKILEGLVELVELLKGGKITPDQFRASVDSLSVTV